VTKTNQENYRHKKKLQKKNIEKEKKEEQKELSNNGISKELTTKKRTNRLLHQEIDISILPTPGYLCYSAIVSQIGRQT